MSTRTRAQHQTSSSTRRFAKPGAKPQGRRPAAAGRPRAIGVARRRKRPTSGTAKALEALTGLVGGKKASGSGAKGAKAGAGVAMLTAAAGLAFKNRDKLTSMLKRDGGAPATDASAPPAGTTGAAVHPVTSANATDRSAERATRPPRRPRATPRASPRRSTRRRRPPRPTARERRPRSIRPTPRSAAWPDRARPTRSATRPGRSPRGSRPTRTRGPRSRRASAAEPRAPAPYRRPMRTASRGVRADGLRRLRTVAVMRCSD